MGSFSECKYWVLVDITVLDAAVAAAVAAVLSLLIFENQTSIHSSFRFWHVPCFRHALCF